MLLITLKIANSSHYYCCLIPVAPLLEFLHVRRIADAVVNLTVPPSLIPIRSIEIIHCSFPKVTYHRHRQYYCNRDEHHRNP